MSMAIKKMLSIRETILIQSAKPERYSGSGGAISSFWSDDSWSPCLPCSGDAGSSSLELDWGEEVAELARGC